MGVVADCGDAPACLYLFASRAQVQADIAGREAAVFFGHEGNGGEATCGVGHAIGFEGSDGAGVDT
jgi:hypothetical protein